MKRIQSSGVKRPDNESMVSFMGGYKLDYSSCHRKPKELSMTEKNLQKISNPGGGIKETHLLNPNSLLCSDDNILADNDQPNPRIFTGKINIDTSMLHPESQLHIQSSIVSLNTQSRQILNENSKLRQNIYNLLGDQVESPKTPNCPLPAKYPSITKHSLQKRGTIKLSDSCLHLPPKFSNSKPQKRQCSFSNRTSGVEALLPGKRKPSDETKYYQNLVSILSPANSKRHQN